MGGLRRWWNNIEAMFETDLLEQLDVSYVAGLTG